jgi:hypothetical protein
MNKLNLLIPVYDGGAFFQECLDSIVLHLDIFDFIIISINNSENQQKDINICNAFIADNKNGRFKIFVQSKKYSALRHGIKIYKDIKSDIDLQNSFIIFLCHDDILLENFSTSIMQLLPKLHINIAVNPARRIYHENFIDTNILYTFFGLLAYPDGISRVDYINLLCDRAFILNMSGILLHINNYFQSCKILKFFIYGGHAEQIYLAQKNILKIYGTTEPLVGIRYHKNQQTRLISWYEKFYDKNISEIYLYSTLSCKILKEKLICNSPILFFVKKLPLCIAKFIYKITVKKCISVNMHQKIKECIAQW